MTDSDWLSDCHVRHSAIIFKSVRFWHPEDGFFFKVYWRVFVVRFWLIEWLNTKDRTEPFVSEMEQTMRQRVNFGCSKKMLRLLSDLQTDKHSNKKPKQASSWFDLGWDGRYNLFPDVAVGRSHGQVFDTNTCIPLLKLDEGSFLNLKVLPQVIDSVLRQFFSFLR